MKNNDNDYLTLLFLIGMWTMFLAMSQCSTAEKLDDITYELRMLRYND